MSGLLPNPDVLGAPAKFTSWRTGQELAVDRTLRFMDADNKKRAIVHVLATGCVAGDTLITFNRAKIGRTKPIRNFAKAHRSDRRVGVKSRVRALLGSSLGDRIGCQPLRPEEVVHSGEQFTWQLTLVDGKQLRATPEHLILTDKGWVELAHLMPGNIVLCEGIPPRRPKYYYKLVGGLKFHPYSERFKVNSKFLRKDGTRAQSSLYRYPEHRLVVEADMNGMPLLELIAICRTDQKRASELKFLDTATLAVHHKDGNHKNNALENLQILTHSEHHRIHGPKNARNFGVAVGIAVKAVRPWKVEPTYDVLCEPPHHNFVANGIVVHNSGKSLAGVLAGILCGVRMAYLTATKLLQKQLMEDFSSVGLVSVAGMKDYACVRAQEFGYDNDLRCDAAPCHYGVPCDMKPPKHVGGCRYYDAVAKGKYATLVVTNYSYFMTAGRNDGRALVPSRRLGSEEADDHAFGLLVMDEAHHAIDMVSDFMQVSLEQYDLNHPALNADLRKLGDDVNAWRDYASKAIPRVQLRVEEIKHLVQDNPSDAGDYRKEASRLRSLLISLQTLSGIDPDNWVAEIAGSGAWRKIVFDPISPARYTERVLFQNIPKLMFVSATVTRKHVELLGLTPDEVEFYEYPSDWLTANAPIYHVEGSKRMNHRSTRDDYGAQADRIDQFVSRRQDRKGIVMYQSYEQIRMFAAATRYRAQLIMHDKGQLAAAVDTFRASKPFRWLASPALKTGYDFPARQCEFIVIGKCPYTPATSKVIQARMDRDPEYINHRVAVAIIQMCGRAWRSKNDFCETLLADSMVWEFIWRGKRVNGQFVGYAHRHLFPEHFIARLRKVATLPPPLPALRAGEAGDAAESDGDADVDVDADDLELERQLE